MIEVLRFVVSDTWTLIKVSILVVVLAGGVAVIVQSFRLGGRK